MLRGTAATVACLLVLLVSPIAMAQAVTTTGQYVVIGWNDLGMHCISPRFSEICILPPYNTFRAVVIRKGEEPRMVTSGLQINYSIDDNQSVAGKTDFWQYAPQLFGTKLQPGIGLTGLGLKGKMAAVGDLFQAEGVPVLPMDDKKTWNPYQHATLTVTATNSTKVLVKTNIVVPVSDELNCQKCHYSGGPGALGINTPTMESNILTLHDRRQGTQLMKAKPVLCAGCHADSALKAKGVRGIPSLSFAMHTKHAGVAVQPACYDCHPGQKTHCNRSAAPSMGPVGNDPRCETCHGDLTRMAADLRTGRQPWSQEPTCAQCHGPKYATGNVLYRNARGHGGVYCVTCHNSPHAWWPSTRADDNLQPQTLQKNTHAIGHNACNVCHTDGRTGSMPPHGGEDGGGADN